MEPKSRTLNSNKIVATVDVKETLNLMNSGHRYLDVRTVEEFDEGHVERSLNIPYMFFTPQGRVKNPDFIKEVASLCSRDEILVLGCRTGVRSLEAASDLLNAGFKNVKNMGGGYVAWVENGFAVMKNGEQLSKE